MRIVIRKRKITGREERKRDLKIVKKRGNSIIKGKTKRNRRNGKMGMLDSYWGTGLRLKCK